MQRIALAFLSVGALAGGFASILIRLCRYPAPAIASLRLLLAGLLLLPFCLGDLRRAWRQRGPAGFLRLLAPGLLLSAHFQAWVWGLNHTSVANATFLMSLNPVFFALVQRYGGRCGAWFSARFAARPGARAGAGRPLPAYILSSLGLAVGGAAWLLAAGSGSLGRLGDLLVLAACLLYVGYLLAARRVAGDLSHLAFAHLLYFWGGLAGLPAALLAGGLTPAVLGDARSLAALAGLVLFPTLVGHTALSFGVRHLKPLTVSFFALAEPLVATAAALLLLGEAPPAAALPAYGLLLAAALLYLLAAARRGEG